MNNRFPLITIAVPVYNAEKYIGRCAVSLFQQTYENIEYLFIDDRGHDNSIARLNETIKKYPRRSNQIRIVVNDENKGIAAVRNEIPRLSSGEFICQIDADDWVEDNYIQRLVERQHINNADIVTANVLIHWPTYDEIVRAPQTTNSNDMVLAVLKRKCTVSIWARMIRKSLLLDNDISAECGCTIGEDMQIVAKAFYYAKEVNYANDTIYHYNCINQSAATASFSENKGLQSLRSYDAIMSFFQDKGDDYNDAISIGAAQSWILSLRSALKDSEQHDEYVTFLKEKIKSLDKNAIVSIPVLLRVLLLPLPYKLLHSYVIVAGYIKHRFQSKIK